MTTTVTTLVAVLGCPDCLAAVAQEGQGTPEDPWLPLAHNGADGTLCPGSGETWVRTA